MELLSQRRENLSKNAFWICVFAAIGIGNQLASADESPTFSGAAKAISWQQAKSRCQISEKRLCFRKDLCQKSAGSFSPKRTITTRRRDYWVPVLDEYNDWMYIGPDRKRHCQKLSETDGPPFWGGKNCSNLLVGKQNRKIQIFCSSSKGLFCCENEDSPQEPAAHPVSVYIQSRMEEGTPFYSFSQKKYRSEKDWQSDKGSWRERGRLKGDLAKLTLMSRPVKDEFEDPIFFCYRTVTTKSRLYTTSHKVSKTWCSFPWRMNFYLYGSYSDSSAGTTKRYLIGTAGVGLESHTRISIEENEIFPVKYQIFGPSNEMNPGKYLQPAPIMRANACENQIEILTSRTGVISSPNYPSRYNSDAKRRTDCEWKIRGEPGSVVKIIFKTMKLSTEKRKPFAKLQFRSFHGRRVTNYNFNKVCPMDSVKISGYGTFCGSLLPPRFTTIDNEVDVTFTGVRKSIGISFALYYEVISPPNGLSVTRIPEDERKSFTWTSAEKSCEREGKILCGAKDICSFDSRPFYGVEQGDQWAPINDEYNEWIQIGRGNIHTCHRHNNAFGPPQWGVSAGSCRGLNTTDPCPGREFLFCCDTSAFSERPLSIPVTITIYSTQRNGIVFYKYLREGIDKPENSSSIWTRSRKAAGDFTAFKLRTTYAPGFGKVIYFCSRGLIPAIGRLQTTYAMFLQPCESRGWTFLYHMYAMDQRLPGALKLHVGVYGKRPHHTRVHFRTFPEGFQNDQGYIIFAFGTRNKSPDEDLEKNRIDSACNGGNVVITAPSVLRSPGYPSTYTNNANCRWQIRLPDSDAQKGSRLRLTISDLSLEDPVDILSIYEVASSVDASKSAADESDVKIFRNRKDFTGMVGQVSLETADSFFVVFKTDDSISDKGFEILAEILTDDCGGVVTKHGEVITSPNYPLPYPKASNCKWTVRASAQDQRIELEFENFDLLADADCSDSLRITGANSAIRLFCGGAIPPKRILFEEQSINITFKSTSVKNSGQKGGKGFTFKVLFAKAEIVPVEKKSKPQCGVQSVPFAKKEHATDRIVGGLVAQNGNFPWLVMIGRPGVTCGGSLISDKWVLTATHCFVTHFVSSVGIMLLHAPLRQYVIIAGRYQRNIPSPEEQIFNVTELVVHGGFQRYSTRWTHPSGIRVLGVFPYNDIALAKLSRKVKFSPTISPACLPNQDAHVGDFCYVAGWGSKTANDVNMVSALNYAKVPILDNSLCNSWKELKGTVMANALCAGFPQGGTDHCWGDSGGSLMCRGRYGNFYINGIVSWSRECGGRRTPGIYTRVWKFIDWIEEVLENI